MLKDMCKEAHIQGRKTNQLLRATGTSELFKTGVPEKIIIEWTGHSTVEVLRIYERTTSEQQKAVSFILSSDCKTTYRGNMNKNPVSTNKRKMHLVNNAIQYITTVPSTMILLQVTFSPSVKDGGVKWHYFKQMSMIFNPLNIIIMHSRLTLYPAYHYSYSQQLVAPPSINSQTPTTPPPALLTSTPHPDKAPQAALSFFDKDIKLSSI